MQRGQTTYVEAKRLEKQRQKPEKKEAKGRTLMVQQIISEYKSDSESDDPPPSLKTAATLSVDELTESIANRLLPHLQQAPPPKRARAPPKRKQTNPIELPAPVYQAPTMQLRYV